ncbi:hypothetical protein J7432_06015 [Xanthomonas axonopodis pv. begoniae]|nr:hypothetical protein [Xanthomonas axonopodis pv. begoniae]MBO9773342.1 hypothetical protein [Xanthomonas axonopodis pv. begoniae]
MFIVKLMPHNLGTKFRWHSCTLKLLDQGLAQRVKASLCLRPVLPDFCNMPTESLTDPVAGPVCRIGFGLWKKPIMRLGPKFFRPFPKSQCQQIGMDRNGAEAHVGFDLLKFAFVVNFDANNIAIFEDII